MSILTALIPIVGDVLDRVLPDEQAKQKAKAELTSKMLEQQANIENAAAGVVKTEAASKHWLAANWRPLLMITFGGLIVARWFGWAAPNLTESEYLALWDIVELGIGGYVIGRSGEKIAPLFADAIKNRKQ
jgi:hypothetical protein